MVSHSQSFADVGRLALIDVADGGGGEPNVEPTSWVRMAIYLDELQGLQVDVSLHAPNLLHQSSDEPLDSSISG
jgi:hypothetical protein